jgi:hypothetical protein
MSFGKGLMLIAGLGIGAAAFTYFNDKKYGKKRRIQARKNLDKTLRTTQESIGEFSKQFLNHTGEFSKQFLNHTKEATRDFRNKAEVQAADLAKNVKQNGWKPSSRMLGALGSALAFYGASRQGLLGLACRTLSLTMFTRALISPR